MSDMPERIFVYPTNVESGAWLNRGDNGKPASDETEYIRIDKYKQLEAEISRLKDDKAHMLSVNEDWL